MEGHGIIVHLPRSALLEKAAEHRQRIRPVFGIGQAIHAGLEGPDGGVVIGAPAFGQHRLQNEVGAVEAEELARLLQHQKPAAVAGLHRVDRRLGHIAGHPDRCARGALRRGRRGHGAESRGGADPSEQRQRKAEQAALAQELAPADAAVDQSVDKVVFHLRSAAPEGVEPLLAIVCSLD